MLAFTAYQHIAYLQKLLQSTRKSPVYPMYVLDCPCPCPSQPSIAPLLKSLNKVPVEIAPENSHDLLRSSHQAPLPLYAILFGDDPLSPLTPGCANCTILAHSAVADRGPSSASKYAPSPATCGVAMLVPLIVLVRPSFHVDRTLTPAAKTSRMLP